MATTRLIPLHAGKGSTIAKALRRSTDYVKNPDKTDGGELVTAYACDPISVDAEFRFSKSQYAAITGRDQGEHDVIAYHMRQSFKPGEILPEAANKIGYDLAMSLTKGKHAFIVCTHVDKKHIHSHIIFNSTSLDCDRKFRNFWGSSFAIRKISDMLCLENGLSIIENPNPSRGSYGTWLGDAKPPSQRDKLRDAVDDSLSGCKFFEDFTAAMKAKNIQVKQGKHLAFKLPDGERFIRCKSLGEDYTEDALRERISGKRIVIPKKKVATPTTPPVSQKPNMLIDIQAKIQQGYGPGFERYAKLYNLKEAAKTLIFLQERGLTEYEKLSEQADAASDAFGKTADRIKVIEGRLTGITTLQKHIGAYSKTRDIYKQYLDGGKSPKFYTEHKDKIVAHREAKKHFNSLGLEKLPAMKTLQTEYATLSAEKKKLYQGYRSSREEMIALLMAKQNVDRILNLPSPDKKPKGKSGPEL